MKDEKFDTFCKRFQKFTVKYFKDKFRLF